MYSERVPLIDSCFLVILPQGTVHTSYTHAPYNTSSQLKSSSGQGALILPRASSSLSSPAIPPPSWAQFHALSDNLPTQADFCSGSWIPLSNPLQPWLSDRLVKNPVLLSYKGFVTNAPFHVLERGGNYHRTDKTELSFPVFIKCSNMLLIGGMVGCKKEDVKEKCSSGEKYIISFLLVQVLIQVLLTPIPSLSLSLSLSVELSSSLLLSLLLSFVLSCVKKNNKNCLTHM